MRKILIFLFMVVSCQTFGQVQEFILNNGLKIIVKEDHRSPTAVSMLWYKVGSSDEPGDAIGVSHALEHMMFKGTPKHPQGEFSKRIAEEGGQQNAMTHYDYTVFYEKIDKTHLATVFELEADRMNNLQWNEQEWSKEIKVIQEERRLRTDDNPKALLLERFLAAAHLSAPYHHPVIGWMSSLKQMDLSTLKQWYKRYYAPNNATLVVVGDVKPEEVQKLAKQYFALLPKKARPTEKPQSEPPALGKKSIVIHAPASLPLFMFGYSVPSLKSAQKPWEPYALEILAAVLDGGEGGRFAKELMRNTGVASSASAYYDSFAKYSTQFMLFGTPSQGHSLAELQKALALEITRLKTSLIPEKELQRIKNQIIAQKTFEKDSIFSQAMELGLLETIGVGWQRANEFNQAINQISALQIQETAQRYFQDDNKTLALLKPISPEKQS